ncbi:putative membrane protein [Catalinimonas alkaloidigena]|uniref:hypothetical protein n=1 Tax=Catalinimonas alkaloidigena TaxID=1075417 RepID=UPI0024071DBE|nr:hypothetical protein [Catalinimonas alkaloidigena]MDF9796374.1 putative membrane protein [Catalinimonas alkaloidigena]
MRLYTNIKTYFLDLVTEVGPKKQKESGMIIILACLIMGFFYTPDVWIRIALSVTLITLLWPGFFYPFTWLWFLLAKILSKLTSTVILTILFVCLLLPVGLIRKWLKKDSLQLRDFKKSKQSVFVHRGHQFETSDLKHPF